MLPSRQRPLARNSTSSILETPSRWPKIIEGSKERIQLYRGVVIRISGHGLKKRFTVRKMSGTVGVERIFPIESPNIDSIEVNKRGKVRRAKLYYLRGLTGKKARIKEKWTAPKAQS